MANEIHSVSDWFRESHDANESAFAYYRLLKSGRRLNSVLRAQVRCREGCTLLVVFETPVGPAFYQPRYKLDPILNADASNDAGRRANTIDGDRHWKDQGGLMSAAVNFSLACDHQRILVDKADIKLGSPGKPTRRIL